MTFSLDPRLAADTHKLGELALSEVLLMDNALLPWFILVPRVSEIELFQLDEARRQQLFDETTALSSFVAEAFPVDKLNVAAIGNVVAQLHVHVIGRRQDDFAWPGVVWGRPEREAYTAIAVTDIRQHLAAAFGDRLRATAGEMN
jgi:diadenosine tetraphosphate (Ap4A) HIT family hydrolase